MTVSPGSIVMLRWSRLLMRARPLIGSPCDPVVITTSSSFAQPLELVLANDRPVAVVEVAALEGDRRVLLHAPPERDHLAAVRPGGVDHLLDAADVAGEGRHDHPALRFADEPVEALADGRLGQGVSLLLGPGRVGEEELDAAIADLGDAARGRRAGRRAGCGRT